MVAPYKMRRTAVVEPATSGETDLTKEMSSLLGMLDGSIAEEHYWDFQATDWDGATLTLSIKAADHAAWVTLDTWTENKLPVAATIPYGYGVKVGISGGTPTGLKGVITF